MRLSNGLPLTASNGKYLLFQKTVLLNHQCHFFPRDNSIALRQHLSVDPNFRWCLNVNCDHGQIHPHGGRYQSIAICYYQESADKHTLQSRLISDRTMFPML